MIGALAALLLCQLIGEVLVRLIDAPLPGPVLGMVLMFLFLALTKAKAVEIRATSRRLLSHLLLLYIPAATGIMLHFSRIKSELLPIAVALLVSSALTLIVTVLVFRLVARLTSAGDGEGSKP